MSYSQSANPNATNSELDVKQIITHNELTSDQKDELIESYVELLVDSMSTKDLVAYVTDDMSDYVNKLSPVEFFEEGYNYWEDYFDEIVEDFKREEN